MRVWIVNPYGELPSEGWREYRSFLIARALAANGHEVTWWISDFEHRRKQYRASGQLLDPMLPGGVRAIAVHSSSYKRNISLGRIRYEINFGKELARLAEGEEAPDLIILGFPAIFTGNPIIAYRNKIGCKLIFDVCDLWPELFEVILPKKIRFLGKIIFYPLYKMRMQQIGFCDGVVAVSEDYLKTALQGQKGQIPKLISYLGIDIGAYLATKINSSLDKRLADFKKQFSLVAVYAGTLGDAYDMDIIISAIKYVQQKDLLIGFVVAGNGPRKKDFEDMAADSSASLMYLGLLPATDMKTLYNNCDVGLMTYVADSTVAMPVKLFDYTVGGLALLSSLGRDASDTINRCQIGQNYRASDLNDFMEKLTLMSQNVDLLRRYKDNSRQLALSYDSKIQYAGYTEFLEKIVDLPNLSRNSIN
jgi:glycosyltransferase involved in cell wall biosynthesis